MSDNKTEPLKVLRTKALTEVLKGSTRTHTFYVDYKDINPELVGKFTVRHPTLADRLQMGITKAALLEGASGADQFTVALAHIVSILDIVLVEKPSWFSIDNDLVTFEIMEGVFTEYVEWTDTFRRPANPDSNGEDSENQ